MSRSTLVNSGAARAVQSARLSIAGAFVALLTLLPWAAQGQTALETLTDARRDQATVAPGLTALTDYEIRDTPTDPARPLPVGSQIIEGTIYLPTPITARPAGSRSIRVAAGSNNGTPGNWVSFPGALPAATTDRVAFFGFGDSNASENSGYPGVGNSYSDRLRDWYVNNSYGSRGFYLSYGYGGADLNGVLTTQLRQADNYLATHPGQTTRTVAMISIGTNNIGISLTDFRRGMKAISDAFVARGWPFVICSFVEGRVENFGGPQQWAIDAHEDLRLNAVSYYKAFDYYDFRSNPKLRWQASSAFAASRGEQASTEYFRLNDGSVDIQGFHAGPLGHAVAFVERQVYFERLLSAPVPVSAVNTPLPVELKAFTATAEGNRTVGLAWTTASEKNSASFDVERSADGRTFASIGTVAAVGSGGRSYRFEDAKLPAGVATLYYRLRQLDQDGTFAYSPVRTVPVAAAGLVLYPIPAQGGATLTGAVPAAVVTVTDALGRPVLTTTADATGTASLPLPPGLSSGVYTVRSGIRTVRLIAH